MNRHDLEIIYDQLKDQYELLLTNTFALDSGYNIDVMVLCGTSQLGTFHLYHEDDDWDEFVFSVAYAEPKKDLAPPFDKYTHWHPQTIEQAMNEVLAFMNGTHRWL